MAHALAVMDTIFSFAHAGVDQANYYTYAPAGDNTNPTYQTFEYLKNNLGDELLKVYPEGSNEFDSTDYRGYVTEKDSTGEIILWGLNWGDGPQTISYTVDNLDNFTYTLSTGDMLKASTLLEGSMDEPCRLQMTNPLSVDHFAINYPTWSGQIGLSIIVPEYSWVAYHIQRQAPGLIYTNWLPIMLLESDTLMDENQPGAAMETLDEYPALEEESATFGEPEAYPGP